MKKSKLLIVDDEPDIRDICEHIIVRSFDFEIDKVGSLKEAKRILSEEPRDVVLLDLNLPDGVGFDLLETIKEDNPETQVLIITAYNQEKEIIKAEELGAHALLGKPFTGKELRGLVNEMIEVKGIEDVRKK